MTTKTRWLLIDDDEAFLSVLKRSLARHGINSVVATNGADALAKVQEDPPQRCVLDLNLAGESGLQLLPVLLSENPDLEILILTGYGSIATAVDAIRRGAVNYLCKPVTAGQLIAAFDNPDHTSGLRPEPPTVEEMEWDHIQRVLNEHEGNVSATARALNMHRRTLQRKLQKRSRWRG